MDGDSAHSTTDSCRFCLGELFSSYHDLQTKVKAYEKQAAVQLTHRDSRTLEGMKTRAPYPTELKRQIFSLYITVSVYVAFLVEKITRTKALGREEHNSKCSSQ